MGRRGPEAWDMLHRRAAEINTPKCSHCGDREDLKKCTCGKAYYCSSKCQDEYMVRHADCCRTNERRDATASTLKEPASSRSKETSGTSLEGRGAKAPSVPDAIVYDASESKERFKQALERYQTKEQPIKPYDAKQVSGRIRYLLNNVQPEHRERFGSLLTQGFGLSDEDKKAISESYTAFNKEFRSDTTTFKLTKKGYDLLKVHGFPTPRFIMGMELDQWMRPGAKNAQQYREGFANLDELDEQCLFQFLVRMPIGVSDKSDFLKSSVAFETPKEYYENLDRWIQKALDEELIVEAINPFLLMHVPTLDGKNET